MVEPVTVSEIAEYLRLDGYDSSPVPEQALLTRLITAAREAVENYLNRTVNERTRTLELDKFTPIIALPYGDVSSITSITYLDTDGATQTVSEWVLSKNRLTPSYGETWPDTRDQLGAVTIVYTAGYTATPDPVIQAIYLTVGDMYENREGQILGTISKLNPSVENLLFPYRINLGV